MLQISEEFRDASLDGGLERGLVLVAEFAGRADVLQQLGIVGVHPRIELLFKRADLRDRHILQIAADDGIEDGDLMRHVDRGIAVLLQDFDDAFALGQTLLRVAVEVRAELPEAVDGMVSVITDNARMFMPMAELVDLEKERARMEKELANARKQLDGQIAKLANENFVSRAPEKVVNAEREKKAKLEALIENLEDSLKNLG